MLLTGIIPGPVAPIDISHYLMPLTDDLLTLYLHGVQAYDAYSDTNFILKALLLITCADYPGHSKLNLQQGAGAYRGCMKCYLKVN